MFCNRLCLDVWTFWVVSNRRLDWKIEPRAENFLRVIRIPIVLPGGKVTEGNRINGINRFYLHSCKPLLIYGGFPSGWKMGKYPWNQSGICFGLSVDLNSLIYLVTFYNLSNLKLNCNVPTCRFCLTAFWWYFASICLLSFTLTNRLVRSDHHPRNYCKLHRST